MDPRSKRRWTYVATAVIGAIVIIAAIILLQQPIQNKTTPPPSKVAPVVVTGSATSIAQTTATLNGNLALLGTASTVAVGFVWGTSPTLAGATNVSGSAQSAAGSFSSPVSSLLSGTVYYFESWAVGDGFAHGTVASFTTLTPPSPQSHAPSVTTEATSQIGNTAATLNGNLAGLGTASTVAVGFRYGTDPALASATNVTIAQESAAGDFSQAVNGLQANTTYYVEAWALGQGYANGTVVTFKTTSPGSGNGHQVPPGWAHAKCPDVPDRAKAYGVRARCLYNETYGQYKKEGGSAGPLTGAHASLQAASDTSSPGKSGNHRNSHSAT